MKVNWGKLAQGLMVLIAGILALFEETTDDKSKPSGKGGSS